MRPVRTRRSDTGNRRVLGWSGGVPSADVPPDLVLGQPSPADRGENRDGPADADSFRWPHSMAGTDDLLLVADAGNHRVLGWSPSPTSDRPADLLLGQPDFTSAEEWPYAPQRADSMRFPYAIDLDRDWVAVADTANNRILMWDGTPATARPATVLLARPTFGVNGENRWDAVGPDTLCWPYGLSLHGDALAVADSGNNRIMIWRREP